MRGLGAVAVGAALVHHGCAGISAVPGTREPLSTEPMPGSTSAGSTLETQLHELVNPRRGARRLSPLQWDPRVAEIAREHSEAMARRRNRSVTTGSTIAARPSGR